MIQYFNDQTFSSSFCDNSFPVLLYSCKLDKCHTHLPRTMHMHHNVVEILLITSGTGIHNINGRKYNTKKGDILIYNSESIHDETAGNSVNGMTVFCLAAANLKLKNLPTNMLIAEHVYPVIQSNDRYEEFYTLFELIHNSLVDLSTQNNELANYLLRALIVMIQTLPYTCMAQPQAENVSVGFRIKEYIDTNYANELCLDSISKSLHMSSFYLAHIFKDIFHYSPMQYLIRRRIGEAQSLLINTSHSVTDIATAVGYNNSNHFQTSFSKVVGMTPLKYRKYWISKQ